MAFGNQYLQQPDQTAMDQGPSDEELAALGITPPPTDQFTPDTFQASPFEQLLESISGGLQGIQAPRPRNFGEGLLTGLVGGFGQQGARVASARQRFGARQEERRKAFDEARRKATEEYNSKRTTELSKRAGETRAENRKIAEEKRSSSADGIPMTAVLAQRFPDLGKAYPVGSVVPKRVADLYTGETPADKAKANEEPGIDLSPEFIDIAARGVLGGLPVSNFVTSRGKEGAKQVAKIQNRVAIIDPNADIALARAGYGADKGSLAKAQTILDGMQSFKKGTQANMENLRKLVRKVPDVGIAPINALLREGALGLGSTDMAQFRVFQKSVSTEAARIINNANIYLDLSENSRKDLDALKNGSLSVNQTLAALDALNAEFANRSHGQEQTIEVIKDRIKTRAPGRTTPATRSPEDAYQEYLRIRGGR